MKTLRELKEMFLATLLMIPVIVLILVALHFSFAPPAFGDDDIDPACYYWTGVRWIRVC